MYTLPKACREFFCSSPNLHAFAYQNIHMSVVSAVYGLLNLHIHCFVLMPGVLSTDFLPRLFVGIAQQGESSSTATKRNAPPRAGHLLGGGGAS
jgi:hypothetical protein